MKFQDFRNKMKKMVFAAAEAQVVAFREDRRLTNLQLHQWEKRALLIRLKRGVYCFAGTTPAIAEVAGALYAPCYFSLEYVLSQEGILPEAAFVYTCVTPKTTRQWNTPLGNFSFRTIKSAAFTGYDPKTLLAEKEKALVDYFYLNRFRLRAENSFWESSRLEAAATGISFRKVFHFAKLFRSERLLQLLRSFEKYAKS